MLRAARESDLAAHQDALALLRKSSASHRGGEGGLRSVWLHGGESGGSLYAGKLWRSSSGDGGVGIL